MISSSGSSRSVERKAEASAASMLTVSKGECWTRVFDFRGILGEYQGSNQGGIMGESYNYNGKMLCLKHSFFKPLTSHDKPWTSPIQCEAIIISTKDRKMAHP